MKLTFSYPYCKSLTRGISILLGFAFLGAGFFLVSLLISCTGDNKAREKTRPAIPVTVAAAIQKDVPVQLRVIGRVEAYSAVAIRSLVEGELWKVYFKEGQDVQEDNLLLENGDGSIFRNCGLQ